MLLGKGDGSGIPDMEDPGVGKLVAVEFA